jgi:fructoselysine transporter
MNELTPKRELNLIQTCAIIIGAVIGSGVFINLPIVARYAGSPFISVIIWLLGGLLWLPQILILAEMGTAYPNQGGPYFFLYKSGSPFLAFMYTWTAFLTSDTPTLTIIGLLASSAISFFFPLLTQALFAKLFAALLILTLAYVQFRNVKIGGIVQVFLTSAKLIPLFAIVGIGFFSFGSGNFSFNYSNTNGTSLFYVLTAGISTTLWAYAGFINILYMAGEVKNPQRSLPIGLIGSMVFVMIAYTLISACTSAIVPYKDLISVSEGNFINPFLFINFSSADAGALFAVIFFISMVGVLNSVIMTQPRLEYAMAKDGLFFQAFGKLHPNYLTPHYSIWIQAVLAIFLFLLGNIENMLGYFTLSYVLQNALVYGAIFFLKKKDDYNPTYKVKLWKLWASLSILIQLYIAYGTFMAYPTAGILASIGLIVTGLPVYRFFYKRSEKVSSDDY